MSGIRHVRYPTQGVDQCSRIDIRLYRWGGVRGLRPGQKGAIMCAHCNQLDQANRGAARLCPAQDQELDRCIQEVFNRADRFLEMKSGGSLRDDLELATKNLTKMYELDAPGFLIHKAHSVQRNRLRSFRVWMRTNTAFTKETGPTERRQEFALVQGGKR